MSITTDSAGAEAGGGRCCCCRRYTQPSTRNAVVDTDQDRRGVRRAYTCPLPFHRDDFAYRITAPPQLAPWNRLNVSVSSRARSRETRQRGGVVVDADDLWVAVPSVGEAGQLTGDVTVVGKTCGRCCQPLAMGGVVHRGCLSNWGAVVCGPPALAATVTDEALVDGRGTCTANFCDAPGAA